VRCRRKGFTKTRLKRRRWSGKITKEIDRARIHEFGELISGSWRNAEELAPRWWVPPLHTLGLYVTLGLHGHGHFGQMSDDLGVSQPFPGTVFILRL